MSYIPFQRGPELRLIVITDNTPDDESNVVYYDVPRVNPNFQNPVFHLPSSDIIRKADMIVAVYLWTGETRVLKNRWGPNGIVVSKEIYNG